MRNFQQKRGLRNIIHSKPVLVFLVVLVLFFAWGVMGFLRKMEITVENKKIAENKVAELEKAREKLSSDIANLKTTSGVEASIREKFGLAKDGEGEIVVVDDKKPPATPNTALNGFFSFLKNLFK
jgi:cell division protein FtsB